MRGEWFKYGARNLVRHDGAQMSMTAFATRFAAPVLLSALLSGANAIIILLLFRRIISAVTSPVQMQLSSVSALGALLLLLLAVNFASRASLAKLSTDLVSYIRRAVGEQLLNLEYEAVLKNKSVVIASTTEDMARISTLALAGPQLLYNLLLVAIYSVYLSEVSRDLFGIFFLFLLATLGVATRIVRRSRILFEMLRQADEAVFSAVRAISDGKKYLTLGVARRAHFHRHVLGTSVQKAGEVMLKSQQMLGLYSAWTLSMSYTTLCGVAFIGRFALGLDSQIVTQFVIAAMLLIGPIGMVTQLSQQVAPGLASLRRIRDLVHTLGDPMQQEKITEPRVRMIGWATIKLLDIYYQYPSDYTDYQLGPINLELRRGETLFLTGSNGSGKTTLLLLLCGLLRPTSGEIAIDGQSIYSHISDHRERFGGVFGDVYLFHDVLDHTGALIPDDEMMELLKVVQLDEKVNVENGRLSTLDLSVGQRKRLAFVQCCAENREIYFFDEWAADQDPMFRHRFYATLLPNLRKQGKTIIVISHDDRYFYTADRVLELNLGQLIEVTSSTRQGHALQNGTV